MFFFNDEMRRLAEDFKRECLQAVNDGEITREEIAGALGVNHTTVSRWFATGDLHFPACLVPALKHPKLRLLAKSMLYFQAARLGYSISDQLSESGLNGTIDDEVCDVVQHLGRAVQLVKDGKTSVRSCRQELDGVILAAQRAILELDAIGKA